MTDRIELNNGLTDSLGDPSFAFVGRSTPVYIQDSGSSSGNIQSIEVAAMSIPAAIQDIGTDVTNKGLAGFDTIFSPYTTASGHSELPHFEIPTNLSEPNSYTLDPFNPNNIFDTGVSQVVNNDRFARSGHNIQIANTWTDVGTGTNGDASFVKDLYNNGTFTYDDIRSIGLRSPMVLSGWGYDVNGKPVPADTGDPNAFASGAFRNPNIWKTGPVDIRWDDARKVWTGTGAGSTEIIKFTVTQPNSTLGGSANGCDHVLATVTDVGCSTTSNVVGDTGVLIFDDDLCFFNLPVSILVGMKGTAEKFINPFASVPGNVDCAAEARAEGACRWVVTGLCCNEEITQP